MEMPIAAAGSSKERVEHALDDLQYAVYPVDLMQAPVPGRKSFESPKERMEALVAKYTTETAPAMEPIAFRPWNYSDFLRRLRSFQGYQWVAKQPPITAIHCAAAGWRNAGWNRLRCEMCQEEVEHKEETVESDSIPTALKALRQDSGTGILTLTRTPCADPCQQVVDLLSGYTGESRVLDLLIVAAHGWTGAEGGCLHCELCSRTVGLDAYAVKEQGTEGADGAPGPVGAVEASALPPPTTPKVLNLRSEHRYFCPWATHWGLVFDALHEAVQCSDRKRARPAASEEEAAEDPLSAYKRVKAMLQDATFKRKSLPK